MSPLSIEDFVDAWWCWTSSLEFCGHHCWFELAYQGLTSVSGLEIGSHVKGIKVIEIYIAKLIRYNGFTLSMLPGEVGCPNAKNYSFNGEDCTPFVICPGRWVTECPNILLRDPL